VWQPCELLYTCYLLPTFTVQRNCRCNRNASAVLATEVDMLSDFHQRVESKIDYAVVKPDRRISLAGSIASSLSSSFAGGSGGGRRSSLGEILPGRATFRVPPPFSESVTAEVGSLIQTSTINGPGEISSTESLACVFFSFYCRAQTRLLATKSMPSRSVPFPNSNANAYFFSRSLPHPCKPQARSRTFRNFPEHSRIVQNFPEHSTAF